MDISEILFQSAQGLWLIFYLSMPPIIAASVVGLLVSLFQALTQIQEQTLPFAFKLIAIIFVLLFTARWQGSQILIYTNNLFDSIQFI